ANIEGNESETTRLDSRLVADREPAANERARSGARAARCPAGSGSPAGRQISLVDHDKSGSQSKDSGAFRKKISVCQNRVVSRRARAAAQQDTRGGTRRPAHLGCAFRQRRNVYAANGEKTCGSLSFAGKQSLRWLDDRSRRR